jgi:hypothetical protein
VAAPDELEPGELFGGDPDTEEDEEAYDSVDGEPQRAFRLDPDREENTWDVYRAIKEDYGFAY